MRGRTTFAILFSCVILPTLSQRISRQVTCDRRTSFVCNSGECIKYELKCDGKEDCLDKSDESSSTCRQLDVGCMVPRDIPGTDYSPVDCRRTPKDCVSTKRKTVRVSCSPGYTLPESINRVDLLPCPSTNWHRSLTQCVSCGTVPARFQKELKEGVFETNIQKYPWHVSLYKGNSKTPSCGGTLITPRIVVTAATCLVQSGSIVTMDPSVFKVAAGKSTPNINKPEVYTQEREVMKIMIRSDFTGDISSYVDNIGLLKLNSDFDITNHVNIICLSELLLSPDQLVSIPGWDLTNTETYSDRIKESHFKTMNIKVCRKKSPSLTFLRYFNYDKFCITLNQGRGLGERETGTGIVVSSKGVEYLYGVVSVKPKESPPYVVVTNVTKHLSWIRQSIVTLMNVSRSCQENDFRCPEELCIDGSLVCDGTKDCRDGADEEMCEDSDEDPLQNRGYCKLPKIRGTIFKQFQCSEGGCVYKPGTSIPTATPVVVDCAPDFGNPSKYNTSTCYHSRFLPDLANCSRKCEGLTSDSVDIQCTLDGEIVPCNEKMYPRTKVTYSCKFQYRHKSSKDFVNSNICQSNGRWAEETPICKPNCGAPASGPGDATTLISKGTKVSINKYPWHVGLYRLDQYRKYEHICGGTIVTPKIVFSAAHCIFNEDTKQITDRKILKVFAGKYYRDYYKHEPNAESQQIVEIFTDNFRGSTTHYENDIAIFLLEKTFTLNNYILPACLDRAQNLPDSGIGTIVGWGLMDHTDPGSFSPELLEVSMNYVSLSKCHNIADKAYKAFLTADKVCALYKNEAGVQQGDSGGGLVVLNEGFYYLYGLVSTKATISNTIAAFTKIAKHYSWIDGIMNRGYNQ